MYNPYDYPELKQEKQKKMGKKDEKQTEKNCGASRIYSVDWVNGNMQYFKLYYPGRTI